MSESRTIPTKVPAAAATFRISSDGTELSKTLQVVSIFVSQEVYKLSKASIVFLDGNAAAETFEISEKEELKPGKEIEIKAGYNGNEELIFKGILVSQSLKIKRGSSYLIIECRDKAVQMTLTPQFRYFEDLTDSEIIEELISSNKLTADIESTSAKVEGMALLGDTDWNFILKRAKANAQLVYTENSLMKVIKPDFDTESALNLQYGATVLELDATLDARLQPKKLLGKIWDYSSQELLEIDANEPKYTPNSDLKGEEIGFSDFNFKKPGFHNEPDLQNLLDAELQMYRMAQVKGRVRVQGNVEAKINTLVNMAGLGKRFSGKAWISGIAHQLNNGSWETDIQIGFPLDVFKNNQNEEQTFKGGLYIGIVSQLEKDPRGEHRIKVKLPIIDPNSEGMWARLAVPDAGDGRGFFFRPDLKDEVVVGFLGNDHSQAIILGMCNSSAKPAPLEASDDNYQKAIVTKSKMQVFFDDDKKIMSLNTPKGNEIVLNEEKELVQVKDQHGNSMVMNKDGIEIICKGKLKIKADSEINAEGVGIKLKSSAAFEASGLASATVKSDGNTTVKGSIVSIN